MRLLHGKAREGEYTGTTEISGRDDSLLWRLAPVLLLLGVLRVVALTGPHFLIVIGSCQMTSMANVPESVFLESTTLGLYCSHRMSINN